MKDLRRQYIKQAFENGWGWLAIRGIFLSGFEGEGEYKQWRASGQLYIHCSYKNGELNGEYKQWHDNDKLYIHCFYKDGKLVKKFK